MAQPSDNTGFSTRYAKRTVLVVDDYEAHRYVLTRTLERAGFTVLQAGDGKQAIAQTAEGPSLILLDVNLPDLSGFEVCRRVRANPNTARIPVVFISAECANQDSVMEGECAGGTSFLFFPVTPEELLPVVEGSLARANRTAA